MGGLRQKRRSSFLRQKRSAAMSKISKPPPRNIFVNQKCCSRCKVKYLKLFSTIKHLRKIDQESERNVLGKLPTLMKHRSPQQVVKIVFSQLKKLSSAAKVTWKTALNTEQQLLL